MEQQYIYKDKIIELCKDISKISEWDLEFIEGIKIHDNKISELSNNIVIQQYYSLGFTNKETKECKILNENFKINYKDRDSSFMEYYYRILKLIIKHNMEVLSIVNDYYLYYEIKRTQK